MSKRAVLDAADALLGRAKESFVSLALRRVSEEVRAERMFSKEKQESVSPLEDPIFEHKSQQWKEAFQRKLQSDPQGGMRLLSQEKALLLKAQEQSRIQKFVQDYTLKEKHLDDLKFLSQTAETQNKKLVLKKELQALACSGMKDESLLATLRSVKPDFATRLESVAHSAQEAHQKSEPIQVHHKGPMLEM